MHVTTIILPALLPLCILSACGDKEVEGSDTCDSFPEEATAPSGTLSGGNDCGHWLLAVDAHAYINVEVSGEEAECEGTAEGDVFLPYDPIYSNPSNGNPKWTFDVQAEAAGTGSLDVSCTDGSTWSGRFTVEG